MNKINKKTVFSDVAQNIYMEATMRQPEWQTKVARTSTKAIIKGALALQKASERDEHRSGTTTAVTSRKNSETTHSTINSKKMTPKKFKLVATSSYFICTLLHFFAFVGPFLVCYASEYAFCWIVQNILNYFVMRCKCYMNHFSNTKFYFKNPQS